MAPNIPEDRLLPDRTSRRRRRPDSADHRRLPPFNKFCYAVGHMLNDLCSAIWFTYMLIFLQYIVKLSSTKAGIVIMVGQFADAISTPLIGIQSDGRKMLCATNVKRKSWHLLGTVCVVVSFPLLFMECHGCDETSTAVYLGILFLVIVFQFGWAATQVSHLSLIPEITSNSQERDLLSNLRYSVQEFAQILCFFIAWLTFNLVGDSQVKDLNKEATETIGAEDAPKFRHLVLITTGVGLVFAILFQVGVHEDMKVDDDERQNLIVAKKVIESNDSGELGSVPAEHHPGGTSASSQNWRKWLKDRRLHQVCAVYLFSRLFTNISSAYFPVYLEESLGAPQIMIIYIPLVLNISGLATCLVLEPINRLVGKRVSFGFFCCLSLCGCLIIFLDGSPQFAGRGEYGMALFMGSGSAAMVAIALSFVPELLGTDVNSAIVYGLLSFVEKLVNGVTVLLIQYLHDAVCEDCDNCVWFYRNLMLFVLGAIIVASFVCIVIPLPDARHGANVQWSPEYTISGRRQNPDDAFTCSQRDYECDITVKNYTPQLYGSM